MDYLLALHRRDAHEDFGTTIVVTRPGATAPTWDGLRYVPARNQVYVGGCRLRSQRSNAVVVQAGDQPFTLRTYDVDVPADANVILDDQIEVTASADPGAVGIRLRVIDAPKTEWVTIRHVVAVEESS